MNESVVVVAAAATTNSRFSYSVWPLSSVPALAFPPPDRSDDDTDDVDDEDDVDDGPSHMFVTSMVVGIFDIAHRLRRCDDEIEGCKNDERNCNSSGSLVCRVVVVVDDVVSSLSAIGMIMSTIVSDHIWIECNTSKVNSNPTVFDGMVVFPKS